MKITLGGSQWLLDTTARWKAELEEQKVEDKRVAARPPLMRASVLDSLHETRKLDSDRTMSTLLHAAGLRYHADWYLSGLSGISAIDYGRCGLGGSGDPLSGMPQSEMQAHRRDSFRKARKHLGDRYVPILEAVVLEEKPLAEARYLTGYRDKTAGSAVALERLNTGLRRLAVHYGLLKV